MTILAAGTHSAHSMSFHLTEESIPQLTDSMSSGAQTAKSISDDSSLLSKVMSAPDAPSYRNGVKKLFR